jgi:pimeloyl-ACP methyl ester carboxylesterase
MPQLAIDSDLSIYYKDENPTGFPTIVLLHGLGVSSDSWILQIPAFTEAGFRVIVPDMRGFGKSGYHGGLVSITLLSQDVKQLIYTLEIAPVYLAGISMGGTIALQTLLDEPDAVCRAILISTFARLRPESARTWLYLFSRFVTLSLLGLPAQAHWVAHSLFPAEDQEYLRVAFYEQLLQANPEAYRKTIQALARFDVRKRLSEIQIPILIISGENDSTVPISTQVRLAQGIMNSRQVIIPSAGHGVTVEKPDQVNTSILEFLLAGNDWEFPYDH